MKIEKILAGIRESQSAEKTASEKPASAPVSEKTAAPRAQLVSALNDALNASGNEKVASEGNPVSDVMKIASEVAATEKEAAIKEAQLLGAAFADAAVARLAEWNKTAAALPQAPAQTTAPAAFGKFASENPELVKQAHQMGYEQARAELEKRANDVYVQGYNDTVTKIHKTAAFEFYKAAAVTSQILDATAQR